MKKRIALLLSLLLAAQYMTACGGGDTGTETGSSSDTEAAATEESTAAEETSWLDTLQTVDYGGAELCMIAKNSAELPTTMILAEGELTGEPINDALYYRDEWLMETYNIKVENVVDASIGKEAKRSAIAAGDAPWDILWENMASTGLHLVTNGMVHPLNYIENLDLTKPYWDQQANEALVISDSIYFATGPISPKYYGSVYVIMFNRDMAEDLNLRDYYTLVEEGGWTIDIMMEDARAATSDIDGDGTLTDNDRLGFSYEVLTTDALLLGEGYHYIKQVDGELQMLFDDQRLVDSMQELISFFQEDCVVWMDGDKYDYSKMLYGGNVLFMNPCTFNIAGYRDMEYDFGILPMPKGDESQSNYISYAQPWATATPFVPVTVMGEELSRTGLLLDAMAAYGMEKLKPVVLNDVITLKNTRDEQSARIVEQLFDTIAFDLITVLDPAGIYSKIMSAFTGNLGKLEVVSTYASMKEAAKSALAASVADIQAQEEKYR